jgi:asparagine synthase (glutamine-hydrolysing)
MCGIAGAVGIGGRALVEQMTAVMAYRGPDDCGIYTDGEVCLGHRRLSILDPSAAGHQPMESDDGQLVITFNGEIYNYRELGCELGRKGYRFRSSTDTETILYAYQEYGLDCLERLEGMFGFALWDRRRKQLLLARDRTGIKPLFYYCGQGGLAFASELKPLTLVPGLERKVNRAALRSALRYASNIENESMLQSIFKLPPGHWLLWREQRFEQGAYWKFPAPAAEPWEEGKLTKELRRRLEEVVVSHMVSDAPLGAALSGGIDSSGVVALMSRQAVAVKTFTVGHGHDDPDLRSARRVAEHCRTDHHEIIVNTEDVINLLPAVVWHLEEPLGQMESIQMFVNYREAAPFVKVLLIGEGADECFAGYPRYKLLHPRFPLPLRARLDLYQRVYMYADQPPRTSLGRVLARGLWGVPTESPLPDPQPRAPGPLEGISRPGPLMELALDHDRRTYLHHLSLKRADAVGMAHSLELRVPFVDRRIVELAARIPSSLLIHQGMEKYILRRALEPFLPPSIVWRRKRPFQMRFKLGMADTLGHLADRLLRPDDVRARGFFEPDKVEKLRRSRPPRHATPMAHKVWSYRLWSVLMCEIWARIFLDGPLSCLPPSTLAELL